MRMTFDATMKFSTNLSRAEIEAKLPSLKAFAAAAQRQDVVELLSDTAALSNADLAQRMARCMELLGPKDEYALIFDELDMLIINLRNLKDK
jgi:hypothetical protein